MGSAKLPNYQGVFLRGFGNQAHSQNNGSTVGTTSTIHTSGSLGEVQGDAIRNIYGGTGISSSYVFVPNGILYSKSITARDWNPTGNRAGQIYLDSSRTVPTSNENRPANIAVNYLIKAY